MSKRTRKAHQRSVARPLLLAGGLLVLTVIVAALVWTEPGWLQSGTARVATDASAPGRLVASEATVDLGRVPFDKMVEGKFSLANTGGQPVRLTGNPKVQMLEGC
ncbi:MAG: hypothetical protein IT306_05525 [Chloroflexi bacterium]|nr:hypothetical protein [Chloroflexota bacterium]